MQSELYDLHAEIELKHWWFVGRRQIMRNILNTALPPDRNRFVVDIGCGTGANIAALADDYSVLGIDTSEKAIKYAQQRFPNTRYVCGHAPRDLDGDFAHADAILLMDVLEHLEDPASVLGPLVETLNPGGVVLITVPADMRLWSVHDENFGHYRRYDIQSIRQVWQSMPVTEVVTSYFNSRLYPIARLARTVSRMRSKSWGKSGSDLSVPPGPANRMLENIFASESTRLLNAMQGNKAGYRRGVSLISILRKQG